MLGSVKKKSRPAVLGLGFVLCMLSQLHPITLTSILQHLLVLQGHLVGVITNGTAVLGLGNIGALAGKPVMEGKAVLFKKFADLDAFDLEVG
jgi:malate dehydrogenase (oxaloacetate-decarboxylating)(NADP+)